MTRVVARIGRDRYRTELEAGRHRWVADEPESLGGADAGPAPYDLLLGALGTCTVVTLRMVAERKQWPLASVEATLVMARGEGGEVQIERSIAFTGLDDAQCAKLLDIAERTPVTLTLKGGVPIRTTRG